MTADRTDALDARPSNRDVFRSLINHYKPIVQIPPGKFEAQDAADWEPSEPMLLMGCQAWAKHPENGTLRTLISAALKAVRDLLIEEARPGIKAAERERVLEEAAMIAGGFDNRTGHSIAYEIRALKDSTP